MRLINADTLKSDLVRVIKDGKETYEAVVFPYEIRNAETIDPYARVLEIINKHIKRCEKGYGLGEFMPEVYVLTLVEQDIKALKRSGEMISYDCQSAHDNGYLEGLAAGIDQGKRETIAAVLKIIYEDIGEHIYRDAFRTREDLEKLYNRVRSHIKALKGEQE